MMKLAEPKRSKGGEMPFPVERGPTTPHGLRVDIQLLRALAILLVLAQHARVPFLPGGFLGVDIFFVVSGYLMTGIIARELDEGRFRFSGFFARRARRLLPASFATLAVTAVLAPFLLDHDGYRDFVAQLAGSFGFVSNFVLWRQSDYFSSAAALKPLLHMWSLSLEEQYYVVLPMLLWACPKRWRFWLGVALTVASLALCLLARANFPLPTFYLLPTRAWELGLGSVVALLVRRNWLGERRWPVLRLGCVLLLATIPLLVDEQGHPGIAALSVCLATAVLLVPGCDLAQRGWLRPFVAIGNRSYSMYLVHWPVLAFANNVFISPVPGWVNALLMVPILIWTELQYRLVEQPFRTMRIGFREVVFFVLLALGITGASAAALTLVPNRFAADRAPNIGLGEDCPASGPDGKLFPCRSAPSPRTLVWGDSFAMAIADGMIETTPDGIAQAALSMCGPFLGIAPVDDAKHSPVWARQCIERNDAVLAALKRDPRLDTIVITSPLSQYVPDMHEGYDTLIRTPSGMVRQPASDVTLVSAIARTAAAVRAAGKRIVLIAPPPAPGYDLGRCAARLAQGRPSRISSGRCDFATSDYRRFRKPVLGVLSQLQDRGIVPVLYLDRAICPDGEHCEVTRNGQLLYRDEAHLSATGSRIVGHQLNIGMRARSIAR